MNWIETLIIVCGLSMDVFASVECQGAMLAKIRTKQLVLVTLLVSVWQVIVLYLGNLGADLLCKYDIKESQVILGEVISVAVFLCLGIRLLIKPGRMTGLMNAGKRTLAYINSYGFVL